MNNRDIMAYNVLVMALKSVCPYRTGNLERNGIRIKISNGSMCVEIGHDTSKVLGEYAVYTNEPWISPKWGGKQNPNQGWIERGIEKALPLIRQVYSGMTIDDFNDLMDDLQKQTATRQAEIRRNRKNV